MKKALLVALVLLFQSVIYAQGNTKGIEITSPYAAIDTHARSVKYRNDILLLVSDLTVNCTTQLEKARSIFIWITDNIAYDYKFVNKGKKTKFPKCKKGEDCNALFAEWEMKYIKNVISDKRAICSGYSMLFKKMCDYAGIQGSVVNGYIRTKPEEIGKTGPLDHAWNVMLIDGQYYFLDATWASGYCIRHKGKLLPYIKQYKEFYWLTPMDKLSIDHFPKDSEWIRDIPYINAKEKFKANPYIETSSIPYTEIITPKSGIINAKIGDTLRFKINYSGIVEYIRIDTNVHKRINLPNIITHEENTAEENRKLNNGILYTKEKDLYSFNYVLTDSRIKYLDILFDAHPVIRFKVNIIK